MKSTGRRNETARGGDGERRSGAEANASWAPPRRGARAISQFVEDLTRPAFARYGFSAAVILTQWAAIAGPDLAAYTVPERLKWPRGFESDDDDGYEERQRGRSGATLVLRVNGPRAVEIQHRCRELMERINAAFGYRAVTQIRIVQAPLDRHAASQWLRRLKAGGAGAPPAKAPPAVPGAFEDERLRVALERMARGVASRDRA